MTTRHRRIVSRFLLPVFAAAIFSLFAISSASGHPSWGIVVNSNGVVYFSDLETIWKIDPSGKLTVVRAGVSGRHIHELSIDEHDNIYGPDFSYSNRKWITGFWKMTPEGSVTYLTQPSEHPAPGMSIWIDRAGNMYSVHQNNHTKTQTLLLRRAPDGQVVTLAGGRFGHADGKGTAAQFSSVGAIFLAGEGNLYLSDGPFVRRVSLDGNVTTLASDLTARTAEDKPPLFEDASYNSLAGIGVDGNGTVYAADAGNRRLLKIAGDGKATVVYRCDPPFFPNGVFAATTGDVYVLEFSFTPPGTWGGAQVRKVTRDGKIFLLANTDTNSSRVTDAERVQVLTRPTFFSSYRLVVLLMALTVGLVLIVLAWQALNRRRRV